NLFAGNIGHTFPKVHQQLDLTIGAGREVSHAAFRWDYAVLASIPKEKSLTKTGSHGHQSLGCIRDSNTLVENCQILRWQFVQAASGSHHIIQQNQFAGNKVELSGEAARI